VFLIELVFSNSALKKGDLRPKHRRPLIAKKLITLDKRGRHEFIVPTEAAWDWVAANLDLALVRTHPRRALSAVLARLRDFLTSRELALADFVQPPSHAEPPAESLEQRIRAAYLAHTRGKFHVRVRLTALRLMLADTARPVLDAELRQLSAQGAIALFPLDDRIEITAADARDALDLSGVPQHVVYMEG
jgi:hypothetical protein